MFNKSSQTPGEIPAFFLIAGLGNPGIQYRFNRHNVGFMVLDRFAAKVDLKFTRVESKALVTKAEIDGKRIILAKPHTYMNLSGQAVGALLKYYKISLDRLLVASDDVDLPLGTLRLRPGGGSAGQKGIASIIDRLGTQDFPRLRVGIGRPPGRMDSADYVLQDFSSGERVILVETLDRAVNSILSFINEGLDAAMNQYNGTVIE